MDEQHVVPVDLPLELADGLDEGLPLDVADGAADFGDDHVGGLAHAAELFLDFVGDVGDDLYRAAVVAAGALAVQHRIVDLAGGDGAVAGEVFVDEAFVMSKVEVGFHAVLGDEHLAVLVGVHRSGIDVQIGIEFLEGDRVAARLEQSAQRRRCDALAQRRRDAAGDKNVFGAHSTSTSRDRFALKNKFARNFTLQSCKCQGIHRLIFCNPATFFEIGRKS